MFAIGRDGEAYPVDSFRNFCLPESQSAIAFYTSAPALLHNMYMRFIPITLRESSDYPIEKIDKGAKYVPNIKFPTSKYTLSLSSDNDIPENLRRVFQIMSFDDVNLPKSIPTTISDILYVENLPHLVSDIQRFQYEFGIFPQDSVELMEAEFEKPSGCKLVNRYMNPYEHGNLPTERIGHFHRFVPVRMDYKSQEGFGFIIQEDMYQLIESLDGEWKLDFIIEDKIQEEVDGHMEVTGYDRSDLVEFCGWTSYVDFFSTCYYTGILANLYTKLYPTKRFSTEVRLMTTFPGNNILPNRETIIIPNQPNPNAHLTEYVDPCFDTFVNLRMRRLIK